MLNYEDMKDSIKNIAKKYSVLTSMDAEDMEQSLWVRFFTKQNGYRDAAAATIDMVYGAIDLYRNDRNSSKKSFAFDFSSQMTDLLQSNSSDSNEEVNSKLRYSSDDFMSFERVEELQRLVNEFRVLPTDSKREAYRKDRAFKYVVCKGYLDCGIECFEEDCMKILEQEIPSVDERIEFLCDSKSGSDDSILKKILHIQTGSNSGSIRVMKLGDLGNFRLALMDMVASN